MTFSRIRPLGWGFGNKLSSAEENQMDINLSKAVDKTGDTITGTETFASGAKIVMANGSQQNLQSGSNVVMDPGSTFSGTGAVSGTLTASGAGAKFKTSTGGRIELGDNDWPTFSTPRTRTVIVPIVHCNPVKSNGAASWSVKYDGTNGTAAFVSSGTTGGEFTFDLPQLHNGAYVLSIDLWFLPTSGRAGLPANQPKMNVFIRDPLVQYASFPSYGFTALAAYSNSAPTLAQYENKMQKIEFDFDGSPTFAYQRPWVVQVTDESGANSVTGNAYFYVVLNYTGITDMRFP